MPLMIFFLNNLDRNSALMKIQLKPQMTKEIAKKGNEMKNEVVTTGIACKVGDNHSRNISDPYVSFKITVLAPYPTV